MIRKLTLIFLLSCSGWAAIAVPTGSCSAAATSCTFSATATGDLKLVFAFANNTTTVPTLPSGWTSVGTSATGTGGVPAAMRVGCNMSSSTADTNTGIWTNATNVVAISYKGTSVTNTLSCDNSGVGGRAANSGKLASTAAFQTVPMINTDNTSWVVGFLGTSGATVCSPTGMTVRSSNGAGPAVRGSDTNGTVSSWTNTTCAITASSTWMTYTFEIYSHLPPGAKGGISPIVVY